MKRFRRCTTSLITLVSVLGLGFFVIAPNLESSVSAAGPVAATLPESRSNASAPAVAKADRQLTLNERVAYQQAIEQVYWRHRTWPADNHRAKPALDAVMPLVRIQAKVADFLQKSRALELDSGRQIGRAELQAEMDRMASETREPAMLAELWTALGNDPFVIAECLARPIVVERFIRDRNAGITRLHGAVKKPDAKRVPEQTGKGDAADYRLPVISATVSVSGTVGGGAWSASNAWFGISTTNAPALRANDTAVWTGAEMIVWGGLTFSGPFVIGTVVDTGGRYDPATDSWTPTSMTGAPSARFAHTAVWTGTEMIIWGGNDITGFGSTNTGGRYNPATNSWTATSLTNAPDARGVHTAVWTGTEMIVWGGLDPSASAIATGGRYNPVGDSWVATSTTGAPSPRAGHTAVWTGSRMIVWGGLSDTGLLGVAGGGAYDPSSDSWTATSTTNEPSPRASHTAVWTGSEMIIWGGFDLVVGISDDTGGRYNPTSDSWTVTNTTGAPVGRMLHTAVWTGSVMVVWGGSDFPGPDALGDGGVYDPASDSWTATSATNAPSARAGHSAVWTGSRMIIWGGFGNDFGVFTFSGFFAPVSNPPAVNSVNAGRAIPVVFSLNGNQGLNIFADGSPASQQVDCSSTAPVSEITATVTAGSSSLSYDPTTDQYTYVWKTDKSWAGTCRQLIVTLSDGSQHVANFKFK